MLEAGYKRNTTVGEPSVVVKPWSEHLGSRVSDGLWGRVQSHQCYTPRSFHLILITTPSYQPGRKQSLREESITGLRSYNYHRK